MLLAGGIHTGYRFNHAKGLVVTGTFTAAAGASSVSRAAHLQGGTVPVTVRFSDASGVPNIPDTDPGAVPRGIAIRFGVGNIGHPARVREAHGHGDRATREMRRPAQRRRPRRGGERPCHHQALRVIEPVARVNAPGEQHQLVSDLLREALLLPGKNERSTSETASQADAKRPSCEHTNPLRKIVRLTPINPRRRQRPQWQRPAE